MARVDSGADEHELLLATRAGQERAFGRPVDHHRPGLRLYCYLMSGDHDAAEELMERVVLTAWRERGLVGPGTTARIWLYRIAVRVCFDATGDFAIAPRLDGGVAI
jgi:DNA-directed RNA polymerase specialized sigma24 family protein